MLSYTHRLSWFTASMVFFVCLMNTAFSEPVFATRDFFYVGGKYAGSGDAVVMAGQMYMEVL